MSKEKRKRKPYNWHKHLKINATDISKEALKTYYNYIIKL